VTAGWSIDRAMSSGEVPRNVRLAGIDVGGDLPEALDVAVDAAADRVESAEIVIHTPTGEARMTATDAGLTVDREATRRAALAVDRQGTLPLRPWRWAVSFLSPRTTPVIAEIDEATLGPVLAELDPTDRKEPVEPNLALDDERQIVLDPPRLGHGLSSALVAAELERAARAGTPAIEIDAEPVVLQPKFDAADAVPLVEEARALVRRPLTVVAGGTEVALQPGDAAPWLDLEVDDGALEVTADDVAVAAGLGERMPDAGEPPVDARFVITDGGVVIEPHQTGLACCRPEAGDLLLAALVGRRARVEVPLEVEQPSLTTSEAESLGIKEPVATFTTRYSCCQSRVANIHRIADIVRGAVIRPTETFSLNQFVGQRTREKGFTEAGVIYEGRFETDVGGGVSQFATTFFNAAFFAGLDFESYQSHSIYISRYPYGREATISWPAPDLAVSNPLPDGVVAWPTYTGSSITVTLWGTKTVHADQTGQSTRRQGRCTRVSTERTRSWPDGTTEVDNVFAVYRPGEGVNC
jgi:vancomycin resistance protein YoaR